MYTEETGITITNTCYQCYALNELCPDCQDIRDSRDTEIAHQIVEEGGDYIIINKRQVASAGSVGELRPASLIANYPSGHDWTDREGELKEPVAMLVDRLYDLETSLLITPSETICESCHLVYNKYAPCPNCN